jgi:hypothetical protein
LELKVAETAADGGDGQENQGAEAAAEAEPRQQPPPRRRAAAMPGCIVKPTIVAVPLWAGGIYLMGRPGAGARVAAIPLIVLATLCSLPVTAILFGMLVQWYFHRRIAHSLKDVLDPALDRVRKNKAVYGEPHEYRAAADADFAGADREWYEASTRELAACGYSQLGDVVNATLEKVYGVSTVNRFLVSADGTTIGVLFHLVLPVAEGRPEPKEFRTSDFESEFTDCTFLLTSNSVESALMTSPPAIEQRRHPRETPLAELAKLHEADKAAILAAKQDGAAAAVCVRISTLAEALESMRREHAIKSAFRKGIGYVDPEEIRRIARFSGAGDEVGEAMAVASMDLARRQEARREK